MAQPGGCRPTLRRVTTMCCVLALLTFLAGPERQALSEYTSAIAITVAGTSLAGQPFRAEQVHSSHAMHSATAPILSRVKLPGREQLPNRSLLEVDHEESASQQQY